MFVYQRNESWDMFVYIFLNNLRVTFITFISGFFLGVGSLYILIYNSIMVGAFQTLFYEKSALLESISTIWIHGALEIPTIVLGAAGGFVLSKGFLFPGSYPRLVALKRTGKSAFFILILCLLNVLVAAFIESYVTRYTSIPIYIRLFFIVLLFGFVVFYFWIYPKNVFLKFGHLYREYKNVESQSPLDTSYFETPLSLVKSYGFTIEFISKNFSDIFKKSIPYVSILMSLHIVFQWVNIFFFHSTAQDISEYSSDFHFFIEVVLFCDFKYKLIWVIFHTGILAYWSAILVELFAFQTSNAMKNPEFMKTQRPRIQLFLAWFMALLLIKFLVLKYSVIDIKLIILEIGVPVIVFSVLIFSLIPLKSGIQTFIQYIKTHFWSLLLTGAILFLCILGQRGCYFINLVLEDWIIMMFSVKALGQMYISNVLISITNTLYFCMCWFFWIYFMGIFINSARENLEFTSLSKKLVYQKSQKKTEVSEGGIL